MPSGLSSVAAANFQRDGFVFPVDVLTPEEVAVYRDQCLQLDANTPSAPLSWRTHLHLHFRWAYKLATHPRVLDAVECLLGPEIMILSTIMFVKNPGPEFVSWHQDGRYLIRDRGSVLSLTAWIALTESSASSGCLRAIPGSHKVGPLPHSYTHEKNNMLLRGETVDAEVDETRVVNLPLHQGQMSLHHVDTIHGSQPNRGVEKRIGFTVRYAHPRVAAVRFSAPGLRARGSATSGNCVVLERLPSASFTEGLASLEAAVRKTTSMGFAALGSPT